MDLLEMSQNEMEESEKAFFRRAKELMDSLRSVAEPAYDDKKWTDENVRKYIENVKNGGFSNGSGRKLFYVGETGSVWQNEYIIEAAVCYLRSWSLPDKVLDKLLSFEHIKFRVEVKAETEPHSCVFIDKVYDLIEIAIERNDAKLLKRFIDYIDFKDCTEYSREEILRIIGEDGV